MSLLRKLLAIPYFIAGVLLMLGLTALFALSGAISLGVVATVIAAGGYLLGLFNMATAQGIFLTIITIGAIVGALTGFITLITTA